jgi:tetratricopeptide (TPR) repeat protein
MKQRIAVLVLISLMAICAAPAFGQATGTVRGVCKDLQGNPITGATVEWANADNGQKYTLKTNNKGEYFSLGIGTGRYNVRLVQNGQELFHFNNVGMTPDEKVLDFDLAKEQAAQAQGQGVSTEQLKQKKDSAEKIAKENATIKVLNEKILLAKQQTDAGNYDAAITTINEAIQLSPERDLLWSKMGENYLVSASKQTDPAEKIKRYTEAMNDYTKAIDLKQKAMETDPKQNTPESTKIMAQYHNNLANALGKTGKPDDAVTNYTKAAELDPTGAAQYYYNIGATLTNAGKIDEAVAAFDKCIAADPTRADAYFQKGVGLVGKATTVNGKVVAPPGTAEAFNKYLELQPNGRDAETAKSMLQYIGSTVETSYGSKKKGTKN